MKSFVVIGLGRFGTRIAKKLYQMNCEVLAVDMDNEKIQQIADDVTQAVTGDARDKDVLRALGVRNCDCAIVGMAGDLSVIPEREMADRMAHKLVEPNILDFIEISDDYSLIEEQAPVGWPNKSIRELSVRAKLGINIIAVKNGKDINIAPGADYIVREDDILVIVGRDDALAKLRRK